MKTCPHCDSRIPPGESRCPSCQAFYWEPDQDILQKEKSKVSEKEEDQGCLSILLMPLILAVVVSASLVCAGFLVNLILHFESSQVKIIWIGSSVLLGVALYLLFLKLKK